MFILLNKILSVILPFFLQNFYFRLPAAKIFNKIGDYLLKFFRYRDTHFVYKDKNGEDKASSHPHPRNEESINGYPVTEDLIRRRFFRISINPEGEFALPYEK